MILAELADGAFEPVVPATRTADEGVAVGDRVGLTVGLVGVRLGRTVGAVGAWDGIGVGRAVVGVELGAVVGSVVV